MASYANFVFCSVKPFHVLRLLSNKVTTFAFFKFSSCFPIFSCLWCSLFLITQVGMTSMYTTNYFVPDSTDPFPGSQGHCATPQGERGCVEMDVLYCTDKLYGV